MASIDQSNTYNVQRFLNPLLAGACAGLAVDITLFPIDTIKTRLQSPNGFWNSGGFSKIYSGLGSAILGSAPSAALFFITYESGKYLLKDFIKVNERYDFLCYMTSASLGEMTACLIRVPVEVIKQRAQAFNMSSIAALRQTIIKSKFIGLYQGYTSTLIREIPFSIIQFPLWEASKSIWAQWQQSPIQSYQSMICGSFSGAISAFLTTPLDVAKTQIMLHNFENPQNQSDLQIRNIVSVNYFQVIKMVFNKKGITGLFAGAVPRVLWISIGGAIFLGGYEFIHLSLNDVFQK